MKVVRECSVNVDHSIWFPANNINFLCQQIGNKVVCKEILPDYDIMTFLYNAVYVFEEKIFLIPFRARQILVYNITEGNYCSLENAELKKWREYEYKYSASLEWKDNLYLFGRSVPYIVKIDMKTNGIEILEELNVKYLNNYRGINLTSEILFSPNFVLHDDSVWIPMSGVMAVLQLELKDDSIQLHRMQIPCCAICKGEEDYFWMYSTKYDSIVKWSYKQGVARKIGPMNLHSLCQEAKLEYRNGIVKCMSRIECIYLNTKSGEYLSEKKEDKDDDLECMECNKDLSYKYFMGFNCPIYREENLDFLGSPFSMYLKYIAKCSCKNSNTSEKYIGKKIYTYI